MGKEATALSIIVLFMAMLLPLSGGSGGSSTTQLLARGGLEDPVELGLNSFSADQFPGAVEDLYPICYNDYDGSGFEGTTAPGNSTTIKEVKLSFIGVFDGEMQPLGAIPFEWIVGSIYNNNGDGYEIDRYDTKNFYADAVNNLLELRINTEDIRPGTYFLGIRGDFRYMIGWDGMAQYDWASSSHVDYFQFQVESYIGPHTDTKYSFSALDRNNNVDILYSGAENKQFGMRNLYEMSGTITEVHATLSFPGIPISVANPVTYNPYMSSVIKWRIDVPGDLAPGIYELELTLSYMRNKMRVNESATAQEFEVEYTPLLMPPPFDDMSAPFLTFNKGDLPTSIDVPFTNFGNVELTHVTLRLDLDNSYYVKGSVHYRTEDSSGATRWEDVTFDIDSIPVGETRTATFDMVNFFPSLPPGLYMLPLDYMATYHDGGATGNPSGDIVAGHWDEKGYNQHRDILRDTVYPEDPYNEFIPFILVRIQDDQLGPRITGYIDSNYNQYPGTVNAYMRLKVENHEMYSVKGLEYRLHVDGGSPLAPPYSSANFSGDTLPPIYRSGISASSGTSTRSDSFYFYANIREDANPGLCYFKVNVSGSNEFNEPFQTTFYAYLNIQAKQPRFQHISVEVGNVTDDSTVPVTVTLQNVGLGGARNLSAFFVSSSSGYVSIDPPQEIGDVPVGGSFAYTFHFKPDGEMRYFNSGYVGYIYFSYYDDLGKFDELMSGTHLYIRFDVYDKLPDLKIVRVSAPVIDRGDTIEVEITVMNIGGSTAENVRVTLPYSSALFVVESGIKDLGDIEENGQVTFTWELTALDEISDGSTYSFSLHFSYRNIEGRTTTFSEGEKESFTIRTMDRIIPSEQRQIVKDDGQIISEGAGNVILGLLFILGIVIFVLMVSRRGGIQIKAGRKEEGGSVKKEEKVKVEEDEEDEEEDEIGEEESKEEEYDEEWL